MQHAIIQSFVQTILKNGTSFPWRMQESIGLMSLGLDEDRQCMLHVWDPTGIEGEPVVHDHPFDFTSTIICGEMTNIRYEENPAGTKYNRFRYQLPNENDRKSDTVRLLGMETKYTKGQQYQQRAHELHGSRQIPGTVTLIWRNFVEVSELTVGLNPCDTWKSGTARPATLAEIERFTAKALDLFSC